MMERIDPKSPIHTEDQVEAPLEPDRQRLRDGFFDEVTRLSGRLIRGERWLLRVGPITLFSFGEPRPLDAGWSWPITGGLLVAEPAGTLALAWRDGRLVSTLDGYEPRLPRSLYRLTQLPLHPAVTRLVLLRLRGRTPSPGVPAGPARRAAAAGRDPPGCAAPDPPARRRSGRTFARVAA